MNKITAIIESINGVFAEVFIHFLSFLLSESNLLSNIYTSQSVLPIILLNAFIANCLNNKFKIFLFTILLTLLQSPT